MAKAHPASVSALATGRFRRDNPCVPVRNDHYVDSAARRFWVLKLATWIAAGICLVFGGYELFSGSPHWAISASNAVTAALLLATPLLWRFNDVLAVLVFIAIAYGFVLLMTWLMGTDSGLQFYFLISATIVVLVLGIERIGLAMVLAALGAVLVIVLQYTVPGSTGLQPPWMLRVGFVSSVFGATLMAFATVWFALREIARAEVAMEMEYQRSEQLLANILPASIAARLKDPGHDMIADRYEDASILFADIAGFTERASETPPCDLVEFLDQLYTEFDLLVDRHGLEKIKTTGDSYMVVSGVPLPRADHLHALAALALDMTEAVAQLRDPAGKPVPIRIGLAAGPVVAGVVGARRFFYDVWGDAVNVASRMESTDTTGKIQVPEEVYQRLRDGFVLEERGEIDIKGKGVMRTWYLTGRRGSLAAIDNPGAEQGVLD